MEKTSVLETPDLPPACVNCAHLLTENRKLSRDVKTLREIMKRQQKGVKKYRRKSKNKVTFGFSSISDALSWKVGQFDTFLRNYNGICLFMFLVNNLESRIKKLKTAVKSPEKSKGVEEAIATDSDENDDEGDYEMEESTRKKKVALMHPIMKPKQKHLKLRNQLTWTCKLTCCVTGYLYKKHMNFLPHHHYKFLCVFLPWVPEVLPCS